MSHLSSDSLEEDSLLLAVPSATGVCFGSGCFSSPEASEPSEDETKAFEITRFFFRACDVPSISSPADEMSFLLCG